MTSQVFIKDNSEKMTKKKRKSNTNKRGKKNLEKNERKVKKNTTYIFLKYDKEKI